MRHSGNLLVRLKNYFSISFNNSLLHFINSGSSTSCPADALAPAGTACDDAEVSIIIYFFLNEI